MNFNPSVLGLYSVRDRLADEFGPVFVAKNSAVATRNFLKMVAQEKVLVTDYELCCVGLWDPHKGIINANSSPVVVQDGTPVTELPVQSSSN